MILKKNKYILALAGIIASIVGITTTIPSILSNKILLAIIGVALLVFGLVLIAIAFGED